MNGFQRKIILAALEDPEPLTEWEYDFVTNMADQDAIRENFPVSDRQNSIINRIGQKYL